MGRALPKEPRPCSTAAAAAASRSPLRPAPGRPHASYLCPSTSTQTCALHLVHPHLQTLPSSLPPRAGPPGAGLCT